MVRVMLPVSLIFGPHPVFASVEVRQVEHCENYQTIHTQRETRCFDGDTAAPMNN